MTSFGLFLDEETVKAMGLALCDSFAEGELNCLCDNLRHAQGTLVGVRNAVIYADGEPDAVALDQTIGMLTALADAIENHEREQHLIGPALRKHQAAGICALLNLGYTPSDAVRELDVDVDDVHGENDEAFDLDDPDNDIVDLGWGKDGVCYVIRRTSGRAPWQVEVISRLKNLGASPPVEGEED